MLKTLDRKQFILLLLIGYVIAYLVVLAHDNYTVKNEYEKQKLQAYESMYYNERGFLK